MSLLRFTSTLCIGLVAAACSSQVASTTADSTASAQSTDGVAYAYNRVPLDTSHTPGAIIDSVFPMPEMLRRFRDGLPELSSLRDGASSTQNLVAQFVTALSTANRATLGKLTLSRAEYAYVYFPNTPDATRDNGLTPQLGWDQIVLASEKGIQRAIERVGSKPATLEAITCPDAPRQVGAMTLHAGCTVKLRYRDSTTFDGRLFGSIVEYAGRFKFLGYANDM